MMKQKEVDRVFRLVLAIIIALMLMGAAIVKLLYPSKLLHDFFFIISIFEIVLAIAVMIFWNRWGMWAFLSLTFATWAGYSLYAAIFGLPCLCLGVAVTLPQGTSLMVNFLMAALSWVVLKDMQVPRKTFLRLILLAFVLVGIGFVFSSYLYYARF